MTQDERLEEYLKWAADLRGAYALLPNPKYQGDIGVRLGERPIGAPTPEYWGAVTAIDPAAKSMTISCGSGITSADRSGSVEAATAAERARIIAKLETLRPMEQPYTRREWAWEQKGERAMFDKIMRAIEGGES